MTVDSSLISKMKTSFAWQQLNIRFDNSLVAETKKRVDQALSEDPSLSSDLLELKKHHAHRVFVHQNNTTCAILEIRQRETEYQEFMCEDPDDPMDFIEASDYLNAMQRQKELVSFMSCGLDITEDSIIEKLMYQVEEFAKAHLGAESHYSAEVAEGVSKTLSVLIPLLVYLYQED